MPFVNIDKNDERSERKSVRRRHGEKGAGKKKLSAKASQVLPSNKETNDIFREIQDVKAKTKEISLVSQHLMIECKIPLPNKGSPVKRKAPPSDLSGEKKPALIVLIKHSGPDHRYTHDDIVTYHYRPLQGKDKEIGLNIEEETYTIKDRNKLIRLKKSFVDEYRRRANYFGPLKASIERSKIIQDGKEREVVRTLVTQIQIIGNNVFDPYTSIPGFIPACLPSSTKRKGLEVDLGTDGSLEVHEEAIKEFRKFSGTDGVLDYSVEKFHQYIEHEKTPMTSITIFSKFDIDLGSSDFTDPVIQGSSLMSTDLRKHYNVFSIHAAKSVRANIADAMSILRTDKSNFGSIFLDHNCQKSFKAFGSLQDIGKETGLYLDAVTEVMESQNSAKHDDFGDSLNLEEYSIDTVWECLLTKLKGCEDISYLIIESKDHKSIDACQNPSYFVDSEPVSDVSIKFVFTSMQKLSCFVKSFGRVIQSGTIDNDKVLLHLLKCLLKDKASCIGLEVDSYLSDYARSPDVLKVIRDETFIASHPFISMHSVNCQGIVQRPLEFNTFRSKITRGECVIEGEFLLCGACAELDHKITMIITQETTHQDDSQGLDSLIQMSLNKFGSTPYRVKDIYVDDLQKILNKSQSAGLAEGEGDAAPKKKFKNACVDAPSINMSPKEFSNLMSISSKPPQMPGKKASLKRECTICGYKTSTMLALLNHIKGHLGQLRSKCKDCDMDFANREALKEHEEVVHGKEPLVCSVCDLIFEREVELYDHFNKHRSVQPYACCNCLTRTSDLQSYISHLASEHGVKSVKDLNFKCKTCDSYFYTEDHLLIHQLNMSHNTSGSFLCKLCDISLVQSNFVAHMLLHTENERESVNLVICPKCSKAFFSTFRLMFHMEKIHGRSCNLKKADKAGPSQFLNNLNVGEIALECEKCNQTFASREDTEEHMHIFHNPKFMSTPIVTYQNVIGQKSVPKVKTNNAHTQQIEPYSSVKIVTSAPTPRSMSGITPSRFQLKIPKQKSVSYTCNLCGRKFPKALDLSLHLKIHEGDDPVFKCEECGQVYQEKEEVLIHIQEEHADMVQRHQQEMLMQTHHEEVIGGDTVQIVQYQQEGELAGQIPLRLMPEQQTQEAVYNLLHLTDF